MGEATGYSADSAERCCDAYPDAHPNTYANAEQRGDSGCIDGAGAERSDHIRPASCSNACIVELRNGCSNADGRATTTARSATNRAARPLAGRYFAVIGSAGAGASASRSDG